MSISCLCLGLIPYLDFTFFVITLSFCVFLNLNLGLVGGSRLEIKYFKISVILNLPEVVSIM